MILFVDLKLLTDQYKYQTENNMLPIDRQKLSKTPYTPIYIYIYIILGPILFSILK